MVRRATQIAFWMAVALVGALVAHVLLGLLLKIAGLRYPAWMDWPRVEIAVGLLLLQPAAQCAGRECNC